MQYLKKLINFILFSNIFVAFAVASLALQSFFIFHLQPDFHLILFIFFSTVLVYGLHGSYKLFNIEKGEELPCHLDWIRSNKKIIIMIFIITIPFLIFCSFSFSLSHVLALIPMGIISLGYTLPVIPGATANITLREIPGFKTFFVALMISSVSTFLPVISSGVNLLVTEKEVLLLFASRFFFLFAVALPFDIRDMAYDTLKETKTIPVMFGEKRTRLIAFSSLLICMIMTLVQFKVGVLALEPMLAIISSVVLSALVIWKANQKRSEYYFSILVDSLLVLQTVLVIIFVMLNFIY